MSSKKITSYIWSHDLSPEQSCELIARANFFKKTLRNTPENQPLRGRQIVLLFVEPSTRTKLSFQMAAQRLGAQCLIVDDPASSSLVKGESLQDTLWTLDSLGPDMVVVRCGGDLALDQLADQLSCPIINGGWGSQSHPTQALLDLMTIHNHYSKLEGLKVALVGDMDHSRVAASLAPLLLACGAQVKALAPESLYAKKIPGVGELDSMEDLLDWCDVYYGLRVQFERHQSLSTKKQTLEQFKQEFSLDQHGLKRLSPQGVIMHPGPINWGVEFQPEVESDPRFLVRTQVENGVYMRAALMDFLLESEK
jgi:aspartate carbamoyltransferase catalytic subunit